MRFKESDVSRKYPLQWPAGQPRTKHLKVARFGLSHEKVIKEMLAEVSRMGGTRPVISTNQVLNASGFPYGGRAEPADKGVAVYFWRAGVQKCVACDQYTTIADNIRAIGLTLEALRGIERWGGVQLMERAFLGFAALPSPIEVAAPWWEILGVTPEATEEGIRVARMGLAKRYHPDGGSEPNEAKMKEVNGAFDQAMSAKRGGV